METGCKFSYSPFNVVNHKHGFLLTKTFNSGNVVVPQIQARAEDSAGLDSRAGVELQFHNRLRLNSNFSYFVVLLCR
jgi:hypothetical protein